MVSEENKKFLRDYLGIDTDDYSKETLDEIVDKMTEYVDVLTDITRRDINEINASIDALTAKWQEEI